MSHLSSRCNINITALTEAFIRQLLPLAVEHGVSDVSLADDDITEQSTERNAFLYSKVLVQIIHTLPMQQATTRMLARYKHLVMIARL